MFKQSPSCKPEIKIMANKRIDVFPSDIVDNLYKLSQGTGILIDEETQGVWGGVIKWQVH